jgi:protein-cysteine N-palmitoyltransferase HHAT
MTLRQRAQDNSDIQYRSFRSNIPALSAFLFIFFLFKMIYVRVAKRSTSLGLEKRYMLPFYVLFSLVMLVVLHGASAFKVLIIILGNFAIARFGRGSRWAVLVTWAYNSLVLFANERYAGYKYANITDGLAFLVLLNAFSY